MFGSLGGPELIALLVLALILFGPRRIPEISRTLAKGLNEFRRATHDFKSTLEREVDLEEVRKVKRDVTDTVAEVRTVTSGRLFDDPLPRRPARPAAPAVAGADAPANPAEPDNGDATDGTTGRDHAEAADAGGGDDDSRA